MLEFEARFTAIKEFENNVAHSSGGGVRYLIIFTPMVMPLTYLMSVSVFMCIQIFIHHTVVL